MATRQRLVSQFKIKLVSQVVSATTNALIAVLLARLLNPDGYGLLFLALSVFSVLEVITRLGFAKSAARYIAEYKEKDPSQISHIIHSTLLLICATSGIVALALVVGHQSIAAWIGEPALAPLLLIGAVYMIAMTIVAYLRKLFQGFEKIGFAALVDAIEPVSRFLFAVGLVVLGYGVVGALWGYVIGLILTSIVGVALLYIHLRQYQIGGVVEPGLRRRIAEYSIPLTATSTANKLDKSLDTILVGFFLSPVAVSYYVIGKQAVSFIEVPISALGFTISPTFGAEKASGNIERASRIYETALTNSLLLYIPAGAGLALLAEPLVGLLFGVDYLGAVPVLQVLGLYAVFQSVTKVTSNGLDFLGRARERAIVKGITSVLNVLLNILLIPTIGVVGAAIATVITYGIYTSANVYIISQEFVLRTSTILRSILLTVGITAAMSVAVFNLLVYVQGWLSLIAVVGVGVAIWAVLSILSGLLKIDQLRSVLL